MQQAQVCPQEKSPLGICVQNAVTSMPGILVYYILRFSYTWTRKQLNSILMWVFEE